jgi:hypothetical protein
MLKGPIPTRVQLHEIYCRQQDHRLIDPKRRPLPRDPREISPTDLLQAKYEIVPYVDITGMKADLIAWCGDRSRATAGRLVHGPGGVRYIARPAPGSAKDITHVARQVRTPQVCSGSWAEMLVASILGPFYPDARTSRIGSSVPIADIVSK